MNLRAMLTMTIQLTAESPDQAIAYMPPYMKQVLTALDVDERAIRSTTHSAQELIKQALSQSHARVEQQEGLTIDIILTSDKIQLRIQRTQASTRWPRGKFISIRKRLSTGTTNDLNEVGHAIQREVCD
jgi:hypothetical protein